jgi:hypothetical protein
VLVLNLFHEVETVTPTVIQAITNLSKDLIDLEEMSYQVSREREPIYMMGQPDPRSYSRGRRTISGTCKIEENSEAVERLKEEGFSIQVYNRPKGEKPHKIVFKHVMAVSINKMWGNDKKMWHVITWIADDINLTEEELKKVNRNFTNLLSAEY